MDLFKSHASSFLASDAGQYIAKIGTMWSLTSAIHQTIFRRAWDGNWWPHLRVQKNKQIQKEPTDSIRKIPMLAQIAVVYGLSALNWFVFQRFWLDVRSARPSWWTVAGKLLLGMVYCDVIYYSYHRLQHDAWPALYRSFHKQHHQFYTVSPEASTWDDPKEFFLLMLTIDVLPAYLAKMDFTTYFIWRFINVIRHEHFHSGYELAWYPPNWLPGFFTAPMHDFHHAKNSGCYALWLRLMDWMFGTDVAYWAHRKRVENGEQDEVVPVKVGDP